MQSNSMPPSSDQNKPARSKPSFEDSLNAAQNSSNNISESPEIKTKSSSELGLIKPHQSILNFLASVHPPNKADAPEPNSQHTASNSPRSKSQSDSYQLQIMGKATKGQRCNMSWNTFKDSITVNDSKAKNIMLINKFD